MSFRNNMKSNFHHNDDIKIDDSHRYYKLVPFPDPRYGKDSASFHKNVTRIVNTITNEVQVPPASDDESEVECLTDENNSVSKVIESVKLRKLVSDELKSSIFKNLNISEIESAPCCTKSRSILENEPKIKTRDSCVFEVQTDLKKVDSMDNETVNVKSSEASAKDTKISKDKIEGKDDERNKHTDNATAENKITQDIKPSGTTEEKTDHQDSKKHKKISIKPFPNESEWFQKQYKWEVMAEAFKVIDNDDEIKKAIQKLNKQAHKRNINRKKFFPAVDRNADLEPDFVLCVPLNMKGDNKKKIEIFDAYFEEKDKAKLKIFSNFLWQANRWYNNHFMKLRPQKRKINKLLNSLKSEKMYIEAMKEKSEDVSETSGCIKHYKPVLPVEKKKRKLKKRERPIVKHLRRFCSLFKRKQKVTKIKRKKKGKNKKKKDDSEENQNDEIVRNYDVDGDDRFYHNDDEAGTLSTQIYMDSTGKTVVGKKYSIKYGRSKPMVVPDLQGVKVKISSFAVHS